MVLTTLLEAFGIQNARDYIHKSLIPYFARAGVRLSDAEGLNSASAVAQATPLAEFLGAPVEAYERALAERSQGLLRGRSAWNGGRETYLIDLPLVVLVVGRLRTPQARRFQAASLISASRPNQDLGRRADY